MGTDQKNTRNWGGARGGSGRKRAGISNTEVAALLKALKAKKKETGKSIYDQLADIIYGCKRDVKVKERITAIKVAMEALITNAGGKDVRVTKVDGPTIYLPESKPDPANIKLVKGQNG